VGASAKRVVVVGVGGLGCPAATGLAERGVDLVLIDDDRVELSNLQRQTLFATTDVGLDKVDVARRELLRRYPDVAVEVRRGRLDAQSADSLLAGADLVLDGTDDPACRFVVNRWTLARGLPAVLGGVHRFRGLVLAHTGRGPCFRCLFEEEGPATETCEAAGVIGALAGLVGHLMAERALTLLGGEDAGGYFTTLDALTAHTRHIRLARAPDCPACSPEALP
jgi:molybdopterin/thiamine biosynthesis adenylyltransferase